MKIYVDVYTSVHGTIIHNGQKWKQLKDESADKWINRCM